MTTREPNPKPLISRRQLQKRWGCCIETIKRRQKAGLLRPIYLSSRMIRYSLKNVEALESDAGFDGKQNE